MQTRTRFAISVAAILIVAAVPKAQDTAQARRPFAPPRDGRLSIDQIKTYIAVRHRAAALAPADQPPSDVAEQIARVAKSLTTEAEAASQLGVDIDEYRWTSTRIAEARAQSSDNGGNEVVSAIASGARAGRDKIAAAAADSGQPKPASAELSPATLAYNRQLLTRYRTELDALRQPRS
jgi:hypothetical protein